MKLFHGDIEVNKWYEEEQLILKSYYGENLIYGEEEPAPPTPSIPDYLSFTAIDGDATISMSGGGTQNVSYSVDGTRTWTIWDYSDITIPSGSTVYMKGDNPFGFITSPWGGGKKFIMSGTIEGGGNIMSLLYGDDFENNLVIPGPNCFYNLFKGCTSLTSAPTLPAITLTNSCYSYMFSDCTNLNYIKMMATDISASSCLSNWVRNVASSGTFVKNANAQWDVSGDNGIPTGWTVQTETPN